MYIPRMQAISEEQFQERLEAVRARVEHAEVGLYGEGSMVWEVSKHGALFVGAWRAVLLQLAHPWVANAIADHSKTMKDPIGRFHGTFRNMFTMVFGDLTKVMRVANGLHRMHGTITGEMHETTGRYEKGSAYQANEVDAMFWVQATLWEGSVRCYELLVGPLSDEQKEQYYQEGKWTAYLFGIPEEAMPETWVDFLDYFERTLESDLLAVGDLGREISAYLFKLDRLFWAKPLLPFAKRWTSVLLPEHLAKAFNLPEPTERARRAVAREFRVMGWVYRCMPRRCKFAPTYFEAKARIAGRKKLDWLTQLANKLVLGRRELVF